ncbi:hypothetical protein QFC22_003217 [Naganishia vaughanmartiniae]|uniref:Uncharacterized protein n=1 Tax=Naganishia vaughanmartiniae TaxID=1424756 RepID=A0ACC2X7X0_9TREE|nr:hypothetical protein QFC22_003217 [Naganishia vaughanmartiniae]
MSPHINPDYISVGCNRFSNICDTDGASQVAFGAGRCVALWNTADPTKRGIYQTLPSHTAQISCLKYLTPVDPRSRKQVIVTGDEAGTIKIWIPSSASPGQNLTQGKTVDGPAPEFMVAQSVEAHGASVSALGQCSISDTEALILSGGSDAVVHTLNLGGRLPLDMALHKLPGSDVYMLALATTERKIHIYTTSPITSQAPISFTRSLVLEGHEDWIRSLDFAVFPKLSDGDLDSPAATPVEGEDLMLASGSQDGYIRLWRVTELSQSSTGAERVGTLAKGKTDESDLLDDDMLDEFERQMTGEAGGTARGGKQLSTKAHVITLGPSSDAASAAGSRQYGINLEALLIGHEGWVTNVHWSPNLPSTSSGTVAPRLLSTAADNSMIIWAPEPRTAVWLAQHRFGEMNAKGLGLFGALWTVEGETAAGKDGNTVSLSVVANAWNGGFQRWSAEVLRDSAEEQETEQWESEVAPTGHGLAVKDLAWDPAHEYLVSVSTDQTSRIHASWTRPALEDDSKLISTWGEINRPQIHGYDMTCVASISRLRFVSGADEKVVRVFDAPRGFARSMVRLGVTKDNLEAEATSVGASVPPLGLSNRALSKPVEADPSQDRGFNQEHISISDTLDSLPTEGVLGSSTLWPEIEKLYGHGYELMAVASSPSGDMIATSCKATSAEHAVIRLYDTATWQQIHPPLAGHTLTITKIVFSPDGQFILSCSRDRTWRLFRKKQGELGFEPVAAEKPHARIIWDCAFSPDSTYFVTAARDKQFKLWRKASESGDKWELTATHKGKEAATAVNIVRDDKHQRDLLAVGYEDGTIEVHAVTANATVLDLLLTIPQT